MLVQPIAFHDLPARPARAVSEAPLDVVQVGGRPLELRTIRELETHHFLTGEGRDTPNVDPRARQLVSLGKDGCRFSVGGPVEAYYSPSPITIMFDDQPVSELPGYTKPGDAPAPEVREQLERRFAGTPQEKEYREFLRISRNSALAEQALTNPELASLMRGLASALPETASRILAQCSDPEQDRELILATSQCQDGHVHFGDWSQLENRPQFLRLLADHPHADLVMPAWLAVSSDEKAVSARIDLWQDLSRKLKSPRLATQVLETFPEGNPARRLKLLDKLLTTMEPDQALQHFHKVHGSEATHRLHEIARRPEQVETARQWLARTDLVDARADGEERLEALVELAQANKGDLEQAQRDYLFVASRSEDWEQMRGMASFLVRMNEVCGNSRDARLAFAALDLLSPEQAAPRAESLVRALELTGSFAEARPIWSALMKLEPEVGRERLEALPALPSASPELRQKMLLGQMQAPLPEDTVVELSSLVADPRDPACASDEQMRALVPLAFASDGEALVRSLFEERQQMGTFTAAWIKVRHGAVDGDDARATATMLTSESALAEVSAARQPGERLSDLARLYRSSNNFSALAEQVRSECSEGLGPVGRALEKSKDPQASWNLVSTPILADSLAERLTAYQALPPQRADQLYNLLAQALEIADDLPLAARSLGSIAGVHDPQSLLATIRERRAAGELRRPLHSILGAVGEAIVQKGGGRLTPAELEEAFARAAVPGIRETDRGIQVGAVTLARR